MIERTVKFNNDVGLTVDGPDDARFFILGPNGEQPSFSLTLQEARDMLWEMDQMVVRCQNDVYNEAKAVALKKQAREAARAAKVVPVPGSKK